MTISIHILCIYIYCNQQVRESKRPFSPLPMTLFQNETLLFSDFFFTHDHDETEM